MPIKPDLIAGDPLASAKWDSISERLHTAGVIDESHGEMLAMLCIAWADLERAREQFRDMNYQMVLGVIKVEDEANPGTYKTFLGDAKANPLPARIEKLAFQVARFLAEFGLTPISAAKVAGEAAEVNDDPLDNILKGNFGDKPQEGAA